MKRQAIQAVALAAMLAAVGACEGGDQQSGAKKGGDQTAASDEQAQKAEVPVEEDFEEEAHKEINGDNLDEKVAELEEEIGE